MIILNTDKLYMVIAYSHTVYSHGVYGHGYVAGSMHVYHPKLKGLELQLLLQFWWAEIVRKRLEIRVRKLLDLPGHRTKCAGFFWDSTFLLEGVRCTSMSSEGRVCQTAAYSLHA